MKWYTPLAMVYALSCGGSNEEVDRAIYKSVLEVQCYDGSSCSDSFGMRVGDTAKCDPKEIEVELNLEDGVNLTYCAMHVGDGEFHSRKHDSLKKD